MDPLVVTKSPWQRFRGATFISASVALLAVTSILHFWRIGSAPPGFYCDESANAYNAYCIASTGADEYGVRLPVFFRCCDNDRGRRTGWCDSMMIYPRAPFMAAFGLQKWAARLPDALMGILASIVFGFLVFEYCPNWWFALASGFCFSLMPWLFVVSRTAVGGYMPLVLGLTSGWLLALRALRRQSYGCAILSGVAWAFGMYSYSVGRPMIVLLLICFGLSYFHDLKKQWKLGLVLVVSWVVCLTPLMVAVARTPEVLTSRFQTVSIFQDNVGWNSIISGVATRYLEYFSPQFLFLKGDANLRLHTGLGGELFWFPFPMVVAGCYWVIRRIRTAPSYRFLGLGLLVYPAAAALTEDHLHSGRCINGVIFWALTAAIGAHFLWQKREIGRKLLVVACVAGVIEVTLYLKDYFGGYQIRSRVAFSAPFTESLEDCFRGLETSNTLYITLSAVAPLVGVDVNREFKPITYEDILFFGNIDPREYQQSGIPGNRVRLYDGTINTPGLLLRTNMKLLKKVQGEPVTIREPMPLSARLLETKPVLEGIQYEVYQVR
jgi:hypothetical protein